MSVELVSLWILSIEIQQLGKTWIMAACNARITKTLLSRTGPDDKWNT
jgi:hypothetical protein